MSRLNAPGARVLCLIAVIGAGAIAAVPLAAAQTGAGAQRAVSGDGRDASPPAPLATRRALPRGHILSPGDLSDPVAGTRLAGLRLVRAVRRGVVLSAADLAPPLLIRRNARVVITWRRGALTLSDHGRALGDAALGEVVSVLNLSSRRTVEGVATGPGRVTMAVE